MSLICPLAAPLSYFTPEKHMCPIWGAGCWQWLWSRVCWLKSFFVFCNCVIITHIVIRWLRCKEARVWGINNPRNSLTPVTTLMWVMHFTGGGGSGVCSRVASRGKKHLQGGWVGGWGHLSIKMSLFPFYYRRGQPFMIVFKDIRLVLTNVRSVRDKDIVRSFILPLCQQGTLVWALSRQPSSTLPS